FSPGAGSYYNSVSVTIECSTPEASIYYTTDGTDPNNQSMAYTTPINITQNTNLKAIAYAEGLDPSNIANANYTIIIPIANANIAALRQQDDDESTIYQLTGEAVVTFKQTYRNQKFVQDATGGILIDDQANILGNYNLYDGITGITGKLVSFGGMLQFTPVLPGNTASSTNNEVSPTTISANTFNNNFEDYEAQLVRIDDVQFTSTGNFANGQIYYAASGSDILKFRTTFYDVDYTGTAIPTGNLSIVGIANSTDDGNFISARNAADFIVVTTNPPTNVVAVASDTAVELTWDEPGTGIGTWFTHALINEFSDAIGTGSAAQFEVAHRYSPAHLASFGVAGATLSKVQFMPHEPAATYTVKIYTGGTVAGPGPLAHSQVVASVNADVWNEVTLTQTVTIPTDSELWIGIGINTPTGYPAGCDEGPAVINYGEMMYFGGSWSTLYDLAEIDANWMIKGMASGATGTRTFALNMDDSKIDQRGAGAKRITGKHAFSADPMKPIVTRKNTPATKQDALITHNTRSRTLTGYNIWRAPAASTADENTWTAISTNVSTTSYTDNTWAQVPTGEYKYAVKAIYTGGLPSNPAFSNSVSKNMDCNVTITLATADAASPAGAVVTLTNTDNNPAHVYTATATAATVNFPAVWHGVYTIKVVKAGYQTVIVENVIISGEEYSHPTITLPITNVVFSEGFEGTAFPPTGWTTIDSDGDGKNWIAWTYTPHSGTKSASSASYDNNSGTLTPDNWLITNQINLQTGYSYSLSFWVAPQDPNYPQDHYSVMVSTTNAQPASFTSIFSETITAADWTQKTVNLPYAGQNIYIAFRHHDCTDWYIMKLDDIEITRTPSSDTFVSVSGQVNGTSGGLQGANVVLAGAQTYTATTTANGAFTMASVLGNASYTLTVSKDGYQTHTQTLAVGATNVVVPTITLVEDSGNTLYPPQDLTGEVVGSDVT
ncbi:MAG TPA: choice-of-anchor J domain-containing protein, partial [Candidatus Cloacimonadota bacterium]|nr:choice-of-anchor J domain-containing protein [Candidatus Cloacimonadota bacterium]